MTAISSNSNNADKVTAPFRFGDLPNDIKKKALGFLSHQILDFTQISKSSNDLTKDKSVWKEAAKSLNIDLRLDVFPDSDPKQTLINEVHKLNRALKELTFLPDRQDIIKITDSLARLNAYKTSIQKNGKTQSIYGGAGIISSLLNKNYSQWYVNEFYAVLDYFLDAGFSDNESVWQESFENIVKLLDEFEYQNFPAHKAALALKKMMAVFMKNDKIPADKKHEIMQKLINNLLTHKNDTNSELTAIQWALEAWARPSDESIKNIINNAVEAINSGYAIKLLFKLQMVCNFLSEEKRNSLIEWLDSLPTQGNENSFPIIRKLLQKDNFLLILKDSKLLQKLENHFSAGNWTDKFALQGSNLFSSFLYLFVKNNTQTVEEKKLLLEIVRKAEQATEADLKSPTGRATYGDLDHYAKVRAMIAGESFEKIKKVRADIPANFADWLAQFSPKTAAANQTAANVVTTEKK